LIRALPIWGEPATPVAVFCIQCKPWWFDIQSAKNTFKQYNRLVDELLASILLQPEMRQLMPFVLPNSFLY
jgi:hypothetical protein